MAGPPAHIAARRSQRRAQLRRRRVGALGVALGIAALIVLLVVIVGGGGGSRAASSRAARGSNASEPHSRPRFAAARRPPTATHGAGNAASQRLARLGLPIYCAGPRGNALALTFDDGPGPYTQLAIRKLIKARERATFFVVGRSMDAFPGYLPQELKVATIGDHTYTHPLLPALSPSSITAQLQRTRQKIQSDSGQRVDLFRPPYGSHNATVDQIAKRLGLLEIIWNVDSADSLGANYARIIKNVEAGLRPGAIILMHENRGQTIRALTTLLPELHRRHLRSVSLPELLASDPPSQAQVRRGGAGCGDARKIPASLGG